MDGDSLSRYKKTTPQSAQLHHSAEVAVSKPFQTRNPSSIVTQRLVVDTPTIRTNVLSK